MRSRFRAAIALTVITTLSACTSPLEPGENVTVTLSPGASTNAGGLKLKFIRVTADSRCPGDAQCIHAGDAQVLIETNVFGTPQSAELYLANAPKRSINHSGYTVTFDALDPYPFLSHGPIAAGNYRATFTISRDK